jgi:uncharacterized membrane protein YjjP (DUF1212 family)
MNAMGNRPYKRITETVFKSVKLMLKGGATQQEVAEYAGISVNTVYRISKAVDYEDYTTVVYHNGRNTYPESRLQDDKQTGGTLSANYQINRIYDLMKRQTEFLALISNKLSFVVEELTGKKDG